MFGLNIDSCIDGWVFMPHLEAWAFIPNLAWPDKDKSHPFNRGWRTNYYNWDYTNEVYFRPYSSFFNGTVKQGTVYSESDYIMYSQKAELI